MVLKPLQKVQKDRELIFQLYLKDLISQNLMLILLKKDPIMGVNKKYNKLILRLKTLQKNGKKETKNNKQQICFFINKNIQQIKLLHWS